MAAIKKSVDLAPALSLTTMATRNPNCRRAVAVLCAAALVWLLYAVSEETTPIPIPESLAMNDRCLDPGDPDEWRDIPIKKYCQCPDPTKPIPRDKDSAWHARHKLLIQDAEYMAVLERERGHELDLVMLGDSITERWNRTKRGPPFNDGEDYRAVFDRFFDKTSDPDAPFQGLALGTSGDITMELLWHLQNGMMPDTLRPKVWLLLIGTNDLGRSGCSKRTVLAGILQIAEFIRKQRPGTPILLHGLLPRNDVYAPANMQTDYTLNRYWEDILWINSELAKFGKLHPEWSYMDSGSIFLTENIADDLGGSSVQINNALMPDSLHPSAAGCEVWAPLIVEHVLKIFRRDEE